MKYKAYNRDTFKDSSYYSRLPEAQQLEFNILSRVFHFKVNTYVLEKLIKWEDIPNDPIYKLVFPRKEMMSPQDFHHLQGLYLQGVQGKDFDEFAAWVRNRYAPNMKPSKSSIAKVDGKPIKGIFSNFRTILSVFPHPSVITCHSYCNYCFRWKLFDDQKERDRSSYSDPLTPVPYLLEHPEIKDILFTGADPLVMNSTTLKKYVDPLLDIDSVEVIRFSSKSLAYWPFRFTSHRDAQGLLDLFKYIRSRGKHVCIIAHFSHPREVQTQEIADAVSQIKATGVVIRTQGPVVKGINDTSEDWIQLWTRQIALGMIPYYMFVESDHSSEHCFRIPMAKSLEIFQKAQRATSGLARTARGPVFMNDKNRIQIVGTTLVNDEKFFVLKTLQSPPGTPSEAEIKLLPFDEQTTDFGNLFKLFTEEHGIYECQFPKCFQNGKCCRPSGTTCTSQLVAS